jgi:hypothetical protein
MTRPTGLPDLNDRSASSRLLIGRRFRSERIRKRQSAGGESTNADKVAARKSVTRTSGRAKQVEHDGRPFEAGIEAGLNGVAGLIVLKLKREALRSKSEAFEGTDDCDVSISDISISNDRKRLNRILRQSRQENGF